MTSACRGLSQLRAESREPRAESREPRAESREPRAESREPRAESREPRAESREPRAESREPRAESREPRAESREPRAESREPRAESRPLSTANRPSEPSAVASAGARHSDPSPTLDLTNRPVPRCGKRSPARRRGMQGTGNCLQRRRAAALTGRLRSLVRFALLAALALGGVMPAPPLPTQAQTTVAVPHDWSLKPVGLGPGDSLRLPFIPSASRSIGDYHTHVQNAAADGQAYRAQFKALGSTAAAAAPADNTATTGTGVPIYWLNGAKAADGHADFYAVSWDVDRRNWRDGMQDIRAGGAGGARSMTAPALAFSETLAVRERILQTGKIASICNMEGIEAMKRQRWHDLIRFKAPNGASFLGFGLESCVPRPFAITAVCVRMSSLLRHRIRRIGLPIADIPYGHAETALRAESVTAPCARRGSSFRSDSQPSAAPAGARLTDASPRTNRSDGTAHRPADGPHRASSQSFLPAMAATCWEAA